MLPGFWFWCCGRGVVCLPVTVVRLAGGFGAGDGVRGWRRLDRGAHRDLDGRRR